MDKLMDQIFGSKIRRANNQAGIVGYLQTNGFTVTADQLINFDINHENLILKNFLR